MPVSKKTKTPKKSKKPVTSNKVRSIGDNTPNDSYTSRPMSSK